MVGAKVALARWRFVTITRGRRLWLEIMAASWNLGSDGGRLKWGNINILA